VKKLLFLFVFLVFFLSACASNSTPPPAFLPTSTIAPPSATPSNTSTFTPLPPTPTNTPVFFEGTLTIKVNVRSGPGTTFESLGQLNAGERVKILKKDVSLAWYQILYAPSAQGQGWIAAQYVQVPANVNIPLDVTPTPAGPTGIVLQRLNVRSGPGTTFDSLGTLEAKIIVQLTGKNNSASWFQIDFPAGPGGHGWVTAQYIQTDASGSLAVLDEFGTPLAPTLEGTPSAPALTSTPTIGPAFTDMDSQASPAVDIVFSATGTHLFTYSSQVSAPEGDNDDWLAFTPYASGVGKAHLFFTLACTGSGSLSVELWQGSSIFSGWDGLHCGDTDLSVTFPIGFKYTLHLAPSTSAGPQLIGYILTVRNGP